MRFRVNGARSARTNMSEFSEEVRKNIKSIGEDNEFLALSNLWTQKAINHKYAYNFSWLGRPIMQTPQDIYAMQELIWTVKPDLIIETGVAHGGSLIMSASMLALLDYCYGIQKTKRRVFGIDIDIRPHNRAALEAHSLAHLIELIAGSSTERNVIEQIYSIAEGYKNIMVFLDSNHTHDHVLAELRVYAPLVSVGSYCVVWDTGIEDLPDTFCADRPWGKGNNPKTAVREYLEHIDGFEIDKTIEYKLAITGAPDGFLRRVR